MAGKVDGGFWYGFVSVFKDIRYGLHELRTVNKETWGEIFGCFITVGLMAVITVAAGYLIHKLF